MSMTRIVANQNERCKMRPYAMAYGCLDILNATG